MLLDLIIKITLLSNNKSSKILIINIESQNYIQYIGIINYFIRVVVKNRKIKID